MEGFGGFLTVIAVLVLYCLPSIIVYTKVHPEKTLIFALNFFLGWTVVCWVIALYMALSQDGVEEMQAQHALIVDALKGSHKTELKELRRKHFAQLKLIESRPSSDAPAPTDTSRGEEELTRLKDEYEERLRSVRAEHQQRIEELQLAVSAESKPQIEAIPEPQAAPVQDVPLVQAEYNGEALYVVVPSQFERVVAETLDRRFDGENVEIADDAASRGIDIKTFRSGGDRSRPLAVVQCMLQAHDEAIEYRAVSDLLGSMALHSAERAYLITTGDFSDDARRMIEGGSYEDRVFLVDGMTFNQWRTQAGLAPVHYLSLTDGAA